MSEALKVKFPLTAAASSAPRSVVRLIVYEALSLFEGTNWKVSPSVRVTVPSQSVNIGAGSAGIETVMVITARAVSGVDPQGPYQ